MQLNVTGCSSTLYYGDGSDIGDKLVLRRFGDGSMLLNVSFRMESL